jgi:hypothetical protein
VKAGIRTRWIVALSVGASLLAAASAHAGAGDDAHAVTLTQTGFANGTISTQFVACPAGERAIGGGIRPSPSERQASVVQDGPWDPTDSAGLLSEGDVPTQWLGQSVDRTTGSSTDFVAYGWRERRGEREG